MAENENAKTGQGKRSVVKYVVTGILTWAIDNGLFALLCLLFTNRPIYSFAVGGVTYGLTLYMLFTGICMILGFVFSFTVNRKWTFGSNGSVPRQFFRCLLLLIFNTAVASVIVNAVSHFDINLLTVAVKWAMSAVIGIWNYFAYKLWVYK